MSDTHDEGPVPLGASTLPEAVRPTYARALGILAMKARSEHELARKLREKGEPVEHIAPVVALLKRQGALSDARYAEAVVRSRAVGAGRSLRRVKQDLARSGVDASTVTAAVAETLADEGVSERDIAVKAAEKKLRGLAREAPEVQKKKLFAFLARQGFSYDVCRHALAVVLSTAPPDDTTVPDDDPADD